MSENKIYAFPQTNRRSGMELRDWFAGQALNGMLAAGGQQPKWTAEQVLEHYTNAAYNMADAMMKKRHQ